MVENSPINLEEVLLAVGPQGRSQDPYNGSVLLFQFVVPLYADVRDGDQSD